MKLGIVGAEGAKFTRRGEQEARRRIRRLIKKHKPTVVVSGACHLGGIDIWAVEEARKLGVPTLEFEPEKKSWPYYKKRNTQIAKTSTLVISITVDKLPKKFKGMRFPLCYHCQTTKHVKSGGCWTAKKARQIGNDGVTITVKNY